MTVIELEVIADGVLQFAGAATGRRGSVAFR